MSKLIYRKVGVASIIMMISVFLSRFIGLIREMVIAYIGGAKASVDAYQISFIIPEILNHVVASGFLSITFIPIFAKYLAENKEEEGWKVFSIILNTMGLILIIFIFFSCIFSSHLVELLAPGLSDNNIKASAIRMTTIILPAQFFFFAGSLFMAVQFAKEKFVIPATAPLLYNLGIILGGVALASSFGIEGFSWGVLFGAFVGNFLIQWIGAKKAGMKYYFIFDLKHPDFKKYLKLTIPLTIGLTMTFSTEVFLRFFGSYLSEGSIASLIYSLRIMMMLVGFLGQAVGTASFPFMARLAAENKIDEMNKLLNTTLRYLTFIIPISVLIMVLRHEIVLILFERGKFNSSATNFTSGILPFLMIGAFAFSAQTIVVRGYYAMQNTLFPSIFGTIAVLVSLPLYVLGVKLMAAKGLAFAISISVTFQVFLLFAIWNHRSKNSETMTVYKSIIKISLISLFIGVFLEFFKNYIILKINPFSFTGSFIISSIISLIFFIFLLMSSYVFHINEISEVLKRLIKKVHL